MSKDDELSVEQLEEHTVRVGDRFQTSLLWKHPNMQLPDSLPMAKYRAKCLLKKMQRDPQLAEQLQNKIANYLRKGYARRMTSEDAAAKRYWYLPVFAVSNANKPGKVRLVWDAAATVNGVSLNTMLFAGPDLTTPLLSVLFKFRQKRVGITADIEEMFHQVRIRPADQTFLRFLWYEQNNTERDDVRVEMFSELRSICKKNKNAAEFRDQFPRAARCIVENHYVDDMLDSVDTDEEAVQLALNIQYIHSKGGFHIRNFLSNSDRVLKALNVRSDKALCLNFESELPTEKVLGMWWIASTDHFTFRVSAKYKESNLLVYQRRPTKREVLSLVMTIYNPLGLIGFYVIFAKIILQEIWRSACGWDDRIPDEQFTKWLRWIRLIPKIENMRIPRNYIRTEFDSPPQIELHTFVDASESSYAAVSYMRYSDGKIVDCAMVSSKTRVAPLKVMSIPRLELKAALLGARLSKHVRESHSISIATSTYWSDSRTVLAWLRADHRRYKQFVAFRVSEILKFTKVDEWRWVPTIHNVADEATKWHGDPDFCNESRLQGPAFLKLKPGEWPVQQMNVKSELSEELRPQYVGFNRELAQSNLITANPERFSSWNRLLRTTAKIISCARSWLSVVRGGDVVHNELDSEDLCKAEKQLWKKAQLDAFADSIASLLKRKCIERSSDIYKLSPYLDDDNVLRIDGRVKLNERKDPVLLPRNHYITRFPTQEWIISAHF
ncbi:uncharacterized protein LOC118754983 [Rhagoletis pomonella]|uniref:uncharacterized protein LOC118754983 n=1 Tax=Rhagoletis pomonella TaxID=28610 RepID=UPI00178597E7|nr:uncharacterized protein LOC118754983 [Rhagoletis pomonella]